MKKVLTALMLCFVSIMFIACGEIARRTSSKETEKNTNLYEGWEFVGNIQGYYPPSITDNGVTYYPCGNIKPIQLKQWVKVVGGKRYYLVSINDDIECSRTPEINPYYRENDRNGCYSSKWRIVYPAQDLNIYGSKNTNKQVGVFFDLL